MTLSNIDRVEELFAAFNTGDLDRAAALADLELVYHFPGRSPLAGEHHGVEGYARVLETAKRLTDGTIRLDPVAISADGDHVMVWGRLTARRGERVYDGWNAYVYHFVDGRMREGRTIPADLYAFDAFWD